LDLKGKVILVSKRVINKDKSEYFDTFFGRVISNDSSKIIIKKQNNEEVSIPPYSDDLYQIAEEGFYELEDGSIYENPDYIGEFIVYLSK